MEKNKGIFNICNLIKKEITSYLYFHLKKCQNYCLFANSQENIENVTFENSCKII